MVKDSNMTKRKRGRPVRYPFEQLEPGQSFYVFNDVPGVRTMRNLTYRWGKRLNRRFVCKVVDLGLRVDREW